MSKEQKSFTMSVGCFILILTFISFFTTASADIFVKNVNFTHTDEISLSVTFENNESKITAFPYNVLLDEKEILSEKLELERNATKAVNIGLPIETKNLLFDCKKHNLTLFIWLNGQKNVYNEEIMIQAEAFAIEISPDGKKNLGDTIKITVKDKNNMLVKNANIILFKEDAEVKRENTNNEGIVKFTPSAYGVGEYTVVIKNHNKISDRLYCDKIVKFPVKGRLEIMHLPQYAKISDEVNIAITMDEIPSVSGWGGKKVTDFYNIEIFNKDTGQTEILTHQSSERVFPLNFTSPGHYKITAYRGDDYWTDLKDIEIADKPSINIEIISHSLENVKVGDVVTGRFFSDEVIYMDSLFIKVKYPDGSITIPSMRDSKFSFTPTIAGEYEITFGDAGHKTNVMKISVLNEMFLEILSDEKNLKVGDNVRFDVRGKNNETISAEIYVNGKRVGNYYKLMDIRNNISVKKECFIPVNKEIIVKGNTIIHINKNVLKYGEIQIISVKTNPNTEMNIKIINANNGERMEKFGNSVEFVPTAGEYFVECYKDGYLKTNGTFRVEPAEMKVMIEYEGGEVFVKVFSNEIYAPIQNAKFSVYMPSGKNLTLFTDEKGAAKFKPTEFGTYTFKIEKENFLSYASSKDIYTIDPVFIALIIVLLIAVYFTYRLFSRKRISEKRSEQEREEKKESYSYEVAESPLSKIRIT